MHNLVLTLHPLNETLVTMGSQKVPGMTVFHCNGRTYGNTCQITFKVGPLGTHTLAPSILPLLEAPTEGFFWNLPEFGHCI
jgi:predicted benzoate:H+ symporter BenE